MRTFEKMEKMMKAFLSGAVVLSLGACEEEQPKKLQVVEKPIEVFTLTSYATNPSPTLQKIRALTTPAQFRSDD